MASPCQILIDTHSAKTAADIFHLCQREAHRIETKYSRYREDNIIWRINHANGVPVPLDTETWQLLRYADTCYQLSQGLFDITSGVLRNIWRFDQSAGLPEPARVEAFKHRIGWQKVKLQNQHIILPEGMELDLGGIGKEYAVDRCAQLIAQEFDVSFALNFGGDVYVNRKREDNTCWTIGIEVPDYQSQASAHAIELARGGIATSGNTQRYFIKNGRRYGHILNPKTAMPVTNAPLSVTVIADNCTQAGMLATFAMLQGEDAEQFLARQGVEHWVNRE